MDKKKTSPAPGAEKPATATDADCASGRAWWKSAAWFVAGVAILAVIAFAYFYPDASSGRVLQQGDVVQGVANGQQNKLFTEATGETSWWTPSLFSGMPAFQVSPSYSSNGLFDWINTVMGLGLPSPSNLLLMMMVGMFILLLAMRSKWYVALLGAIAYGFSSYFIIIIGAGHIWKFITLAYIPPTIAGIVLCYRGRYLLGGALTALFAMLQISANHVQMTYYFLFVVAGFILVYFITALREHRLRSFAIATAVVVVAGALGVVANLPSLYHTYEYSKETIRGNHSELTQPTSSQDATSGLDRSYITQYSYEKGETFTLLIPDVKGGSSAHSLAQLDEVQEMAANGTLDPAFGQYLAILSQLGGSLPQYFGGEEGTSGPVYVGALIFALFLVGCFVVKGPMKWVLIALTLFSILLAWGRNFMGLTDLMIDYMPMYSKFRTVESILVIAEFTMPLMAALALQQLLADREKAKSYVRPVLIGFGATLLICLAAIVAPSLFGEVITETDRMIDSQVSQVLINSGFSPSDVATYSFSNPSIVNAIETLRYSMVESDGLRSFFIVAFGLIVLMLYYRRYINPMWTTVIMAAIVLVDLYSVNKRYLNTDSFHDRPAANPTGIPRSQLDDYILQDTTMNFRVMNVPYFQSAVPSYYHQAVGGYHAAKLTRYQDLIDRHLGHFGRQATPADSAVLDMLNARYIIDLSADGQGLNVEVNPRAMGNAWWVDSIAVVNGADAEMAALSTVDLRHTAVADSPMADLLGEARPITPGDTIYETAFAPNRLAYHSRSAQGGVAVFSEVYFPWGWNVTIDGEEVAAPARVNYVLRALPIPAGEHEIVMTFDPRSIHTTETAATIAIILIYVALAAAVVGAIACPRLRRRRESKNTQPTAA